MREIIKKISPEVILLLSFLSAIFIGAILLKLPFCTPHGIEFIDALFTSTSAVCVTGLVVLDTGKDFTLWGQMIILFLIQIGGLGIMTFSVFFLLFLKEKIPLNAKVAIASTLSKSSFNLKKLIINIFCVTLLIELSGAVLLFLYFYNKQFGLSNSIYYALFHSISAFCNAGFSLFSNSLIDYQSSWYMNLIMISLIIAGGIGFTVYLDIKNKKLSLHSKIVLFASGFLIFIGTISIFFLEYGNSLKGLPLDSKILVSLFQSITPRTAGFNTIDLSTFKDGSLLIIMLLMFIGASPGSCGGGVKTTTFIIFIMTIFSTAKGRDYISIFKRTISKEVIFKSFAIILIAITFLLLGIVGLSLCDNNPMNRGDFFSYTFEAFSAMGTVGLSIGYTKKLTIIGKIIIILLMFLGRIGPLTLVLALRGKKRVNLKFAEENIMIG
jgi:trk system potassium uptake protein TrkH